MSDHQTQTRSTAASQVHPDLRPIEMTDLDRALFTSDDAYSKDWQEHRVAWIREAATLYVERFLPYERLGSQLGFDPDFVREPHDLSLVPVLPSSVFKSDLLTASGMPDGATQRCTSSGTQGTKSVVLRDPRTMDRFMGSIAQGVREFLTQDAVWRALLLSPRVTEEDDLWFAFVLGLLELEFAAQYFVQDETFAIADVYEALAATEDGVRPVVIGPPALLAELLQWMDRNGFRLDLGQRDGVVITAGGWKRRANETVPRGALEELATDLLGISRTAFRDIFNMVELNSVLFECEEHRKHVPPTIELLVRDPADLSPTSAGELGVISYLDPTPTSYPGFVLSDDLGLIDTTTCPCGRIGTTVQFVRRLKRLEERGCAIKMDRYATRPAIGVREGR